MIIDRRESFAYKVSHFKSEIFLIALVAAIWYFLGAAIDTHLFEDGVAICQDWNQAQVKKAIAGRTDVEVYYVDCRKGK